MKIRDYSHAQSFDHMGKVIYHDPDQGITIYAGNIFEARTVKGTTNLIIAMRVINGYMYYMHSDKARKVPLEHFIRAVESGELEPRRASEIDTERLAMCAIAADAMYNRRTGEEMIELMGEGAEERFLQRD